MKKIIPVLLSFCLLCMIVLIPSAQASSFDYLVHVKRSKITCVPGASIQFQFSLKNQTKKPAEIQLKKKLMNHNYEFSYQILVQDSPASAYFTLLAGQEMKFTALISTTTSVPVGSRGVIQCQFLVEDSIVAEVLLNFYVVEKIVMILRIGNKTVQIQDQDPYELDSPPYIRISRTFVPLRFIGESFGATIGWFASEKKVTYSLRGVQITFWIDNDSYLVNGVFKKMDVPPEIQPPGRTFVPLRVVSEELGATVDWNASQQTIKITFTPK